MLNRASEIHDSVLAAVSIAQGVAELRFSLVYIHRTEGDSGRDPGTVWGQEAILRIKDATVSGAFSQLPVDLWDGRITLGESQLDNLIPIPLSAANAIELRLEAWPQSQEVVTFSGNGVELELIGEPDYLEDFRP